MLNKIKKYMDRAFEVIDIVGVAVGLLLIYWYVGLWVKAYYRIEVVRDDFFRINFWIMPIYFSLGISFFLTSLKWEKRRRDYALIGICCWVLLYVFYKLFADYIKVLVLPFLAS